MIKPAGSLSQIAVTEFGWRLTGLLITELRENKPCPSRTVPKGGPEGMITIGTHWHRYSKNVVLQKLCSSSCDKSKEGLSFLSFVLEASHMQVPPMFRESCVIKEEQVQQLACPSAVMCPVKVAKHQRHSCTQRSLDTDKGILRPHRWPFGYQLLNMWHWICEEDFVYLVCLCEMSPHVDQLLILGVFNVHVCCSSDQLGREIVNLLDP